MFLIASNDHLRYLNLSKLSYVETMASVSFITANAQLCLSLEDIMFYTSYGISTGQTTGCKTDES